MLFGDYPTARNIHLADMFLIVAFVVVHVGVALLGWFLPNAPMGDVYLVYEPWSSAALSVGIVNGENVGIVGLTVPWVYPQLALLPMVLAPSLGPAESTFAQIA